MALNSQLPTFQIMTNYDAHVLILCLYYLITTVRHSLTPRWSFLCKIFQEGRHLGKHGLQTPNKAFFIENPNFLAWEDKLGRIDFGAFGVSSANLSALILVL